MIYLLDTDHLSILQRKAGAEYVRLSTWMAQHAPTDFACCVVSLHEQLLGAHALLNQAKSSGDLVRGYVLLERLPPTTSRSRFSLLTHERRDIRRFARSESARGNDGPAFGRDRPLSESDGANSQSSRLRPRAGSEG